MRRRKMSGKKSRKLFTKTAQRHHPKNSMNTSVEIMRGGIRL
jgi:hypothetical protein